jgi:hypothetical protein
LTATQAGSRRGDERRAVRDDDLGGPLGGAAGRRRGGERLGPHPCRVGVEAEDDLRLPRGDGGRQPVGEAAV